MAPGVFPSRAVASVRAMVPAGMSNALGWHLQLSIIKLLEFQCGRIKVPINALRSGSWVPLPSRRCWIVSGTKLDLRPSGPVDWNAAIKLAANC